MFFSVYFKKEMSTFGVYNVKSELEFEKCECCKHLSKTYLKLRVNIIKRWDSFSVMAGNYLPARVRFCYGPKKTICATDTRCRSLMYLVFLTKGMNNMVCCIMFNLCILHG